MLVLLASQKFNMLTKNQLHRMNIENHYDWHSPGKCGRGPSIYIHKLSEFLKYNLTDFKLFILDIPFLNT